MLLDANKTLSKFMVGKKPDIRRFTDTIGTMITQACNRTDRAARVYGEMVDLLWRRDNREGAIRLETLWNLLAKSHAFSLLCGYAIDQFCKGGFEDVCRPHTHVVSETGRAVELDG